MTETKTAVTKITKAELVETQGPHFYATNLEQMQAAQQGMIAQFVDRLTKAENDLRDCQEAFRLATEGGYKLAPFSRNRSRAQKRVEFCEKVIAALQAGYTVIPDIPGAEQFMVRTNRPVKQQCKQMPHYSSRNDARSVMAVTSESPPLGEGFNVDPWPLVDTDGHVYENDKKIKKQNWWTEDHCTEVDFPMIVAHPFVLEHVNAAAKRLIFDDFTCLPTPRQRKGDPIVVGRIRYPNQGSYGHRHLSFLIAWYVDIRTV